MYFQPSDPGNRLKTVPRTSKWCGPNSEHRTTPLEGVVEFDEGVAVPRVRVTHWSCDDGRHEEDKSARFRAGAFVKGGRA